MASESIHPFGRFSFKSEDNNPLKVNMVSTKDSDTPVPTYVLQCKSEPESLYETPSPHPGSNQSGLLVSSTAGGNLMLFMPESECNPSSIKTEPVVTMEDPLDHSTFNPNSPEAASPMSTTCSTGSSAYSPSSPSVSSMGVPSPSCTSRDNDLMLFDEDTISSLASILEDANEDRISSSQRMLKCPRTSMAQTCHNIEAQVPERTTHQQPQQSVFNFGQATSNTQFIETNFSAVTDISNQNTRTSSRSRTKKSSSHSDRDLIVPQRKVTRTRGKKNHSLTMSLPCRQDGMELQIVVQPEKQHRARYLTEGSRGSVKDESQQGFPTLKLVGVRDPVSLQVFVAADLPNKVKPHGFYQACKVTGRNTTPCSETDIDGTTIIEIQWKLDEDTDDMEIRLDCVGILKLRNADVEQRIGLTRLKRKNTAVRLVFRVHIERSDGSMTTLQQVSSAVCCTQPLGHPEILKKSLTRCSAEGGEELFIIGKNFVNKNTTVKLQEMDAAGAISWEGECDIDKSLFHNTHIVCTTPKYRRSKLEEDAEVYLVVSSGSGKTSEQYGHPMYYYVPGAGQNTGDSISVSSSEVHTTNSEGTLTFDLASLQIPPSQENSMDAPMSVMDVLNSFGQSTQQPQKETQQQILAETQHQQILPETSTPSVAHLDTSQMHLTMSQVQPVMTPVPTSGNLVPTQTAVTMMQTQPASTIQPVTSEIKRIASPASASVKTQLDTLTAQLQHVTSQPQASVAQPQLQQTTPEPNLSPILTPVGSPKAPTATVNSLLNQITSNQNMFTSSPALQLSSLLQQQQGLQQQLQQQQQEQLLPAETLLQAAQSLQVLQAQLQAQAVQMQALQPQVQAAAMQVSTQLQLHAHKLQEQLNKKEQQGNDVIQLQPVQQQPQQRLVDSQSNEVSFADKLKAAAQMEVNQPGLLTKLAQQQNLLGSTTTAAMPQQQTPVTILPTLPSTVCSVLNIQ